MTPPSVSRFLLSLQCFLFLFLICGISPAESICEGDSSSEEKMSLSLSGQKRPNSVVLTLTLGSGITKAVRVYSEPSHTLLGVFVDSESRVADSDWMAQIETPRTVMSLPFRSGSVARLQTVPRPLTDHTIDVFVFGDWPRVGSSATEEKDQLYGRYRVGSGDFGFSHTRLGDGGSSVCCGSPPFTGPCDACVSSCKNDEYTCCREQEGVPGCTGFCQKHKVYCGIIFCPFC